MSADTSSVTVDGPTTPSEASSIFAPSAPLPAPGTPPPVWSYLCKPFEGTAEGHSVQTLSSVSGLTYHQQYSNRMTEPKRSSSRSSTRSRRSTAEADDNPYLDTASPDEAPAKPRATRRKAPAQAPEEEASVEAKKPRLTRRRSTASTASAVSSATTAESKTDSNSKDEPAAPVRRRSTRRSSAEAESQADAAARPEPRPEPAAPAPPPTAHAERSDRPEEPRTARTIEHSTTIPPIVPPEIAPWVRSDLVKELTHKQRRPYRDPSSSTQLPADNMFGEAPEGPNQYDRAFDRTDGPERQESRSAYGEQAPTGERSYSAERYDRRERGGKRRGRGRHQHSSGERPNQWQPPGERTERPDRQDSSDRNDRSGKRGSRRGRSRFRKNGSGSGEIAAFGGSPAGTPLSVDGSTSGWFDPSRDGGFVRQAANSYLPDPSDAFVPPALVKLHQLRRGDLIEATYGRDHRNRSAVIEIQSLNDGSPVVLEKRSDFNTLVASYPDRKLTLETGQPAKSGPELTRRAIDLIAPIGYGQRALIVAPARAGKTTLLQAIVEGVALNHPDAVLFVLLVDERPEEVSEMITWGYGEVVASSFDMPPKRHVEVAEMTLERARRLVEQGKDVVIVLDSITRLARAHNTVDRGTGRTMSGGLDATAMQKPKAFFGSARMIALENGGGSLTIIATALVETGSRMDDVIFEEFKGTGNCEIKLDRSLADRRIFPAFDIATSGTRREEKLFRPDQLEKVHLLRRGLHQLPPQSGMEWLIKRIAGTSNNDSLLDGL